MPDPRKPARDLSRWSLVKLGMLTITLSTTGMGSGCSHLRSAGDPDPRVKAVAAPSRGGLPVTEQVIRAEPHSGDPLTSLEHELTRVHSDRVIVSTALLKSLVKNERLHQTQCKSISGQLEAIKNVDLEEAGGTASAESSVE